MGERNIKLLIEYDGTAYHGWQVQAQPSVQQALLEAIERLTGERVRLRVAGRTDAGVHALGQTANFLTRSAIPPDKFAPALNQQLPPDIVVRRSAEVPLDFDAKADSLGKLYRYRVFNDWLGSALERQRAWHVRPRLDLEAMRRAAQPLVGEHDFESFRSAHCDAAHAIRRIDELAIAASPSADQQGRLIIFDVRGNAFCRHMVRIIVGTLVQVGSGLHPPEQVAAMLAARDRRRAGVTAPPQGLYLVQVVYPA